MKKSQAILVGYVVFVVSYAFSIHFLTRENEKSLPQTKDGAHLEVVRGTMDTTPVAMAVTPTQELALKQPEISRSKVDTPNAPLFPYIKITDGCGAYYEGACVNVRSGPGTTYPVISTLRSGAVLRTEEKVTADEREWHKVVFDEWVRYPERIGGTWYVAAEYVEAFENVGILEATSTTPTTSKSILIDRGEQKLYAYDGDTLFMEESVSTGHDATPTPRGTFTIFRKTPSRYMQGPLPNISDDYYDLPGVPWNLYFTHEGAAIHGAYWHDKFGQRWSHGCVNLHPDTAEKLYTWADLGTTVTVRD